MYRYTVARKRETISYVLFMSPIFIHDTKFVWGFRSWLYLSLAMPFFIRRTKNFTSSSGDKKSYMLPLEPCSTNIMERTQEGARPPLYSLIKGSPNYEKRERTCSAGEASIKRTNLFGRIRGVRFLQTVPGNTTPQVHSSMVCFVAFFEGLRGLQFAHRRLPPLMGDRKADYPLQRPSKCFLLDRGG